MHGSRYLFGRCVETILGAIELALLDESDLTIEFFADRYATQEGCSWKDNVFLTQNWRRIDHGEPEREMT